MGTSSEDLVFNILTRGDQRSARALRNVGDAADHTAGRISGLSKAMAALGALPAINAVGAAGLGGLLSLPAAAGAGAAAIGTLTMAMHGLKDGLEQAAGGRALEGLEFGGLSHSAATFAIEITRARDAMHGLQQTVQERTFAPMVGAVDLLASKYLPVLTRGLPPIADALGRVGRSLATELGSTSNLEHVATILESTRTSTTNLGRVLRSVTGLFLELGASGSKSWERMTADLARGTAAFEKFFASARADGSLDRLFGTAEDALQGIMRALAPLGRALYDAFSGQGAAAGVQSLVTILGTLSRVTAFLIDTFSSLPAGMQGALLTIGAMGLVATKTFSAVKSLSAGMALTALSMESLGLAGTKAATGMAAASTAVSRAAGPIGVAVAVVGLLSVALMNAKDQTKPLERDLGKLTESALTFAESGRVVGEFAETTGGGLGMLAKRSRELGDVWDSTFGGFDRMAHTTAENWEYTRKQTELMKETGKGLDTLWRDAEKSQNQLNEDIKKTTQATAELARSGDVKAAGVLYAQFADAFTRQGYSIDWVNDKMQDYLNITGGLTLVQFDSVKATRAVDQAQVILNGTWQDALNKLGSMSAAYSLLNDTSNKYLNAQIGYEGAIDDLTESLDRNAHAWDLHTKAGRDNQQAMLGAIDKAAEYATQTYNTSLETKSETEALKDQEKAWRDSIKEIHDTAIAHGIAQQSVEDFIAAHARMPTGGAVPITVPGASDSIRQVEELEKQIGELKSRQVEITAAGAVDAARRVNELQRQIDALTSKEIQIKTVIWEQRNYSSSGDFGSTHGYRMGGITPQHARMGLLSSANVFKGGPPLYAFAEPGTEQEAFIPKNGDTGRSRGLARRVVDDWLGGPEKLWPGMGGGGASSAAISQLAAAVAALAGQRNRVDLTVSATSSDPFVEWLIFALRQAIQARGGNVQQALGTNR